MSDVTAEQGNVESLSQFADTPRGQHELWSAEMDASFKAQEKFHKQGNKVVGRYLDNRDAGEEDWFRLNFFYSNIKTQKDMLFGKLPEVSFDRTNYDFNDDVARIAAMILQRMLQADIGTPNDEYSDCLRENLQDRLLPGLGVARVRYEFDSRTEEVPPQFTLDGQLMTEGFTNEIITDQRAPIEYVHWRDIAWSPCRTWRELRWISFKTNPTRDQLVARFGKELGNAIPLTTDSPNDKDEKMTQEKPDPKKDAWSRAEVWEIWNKETKQVIWWCKGYSSILDTKPDPLGMVGFFPIPRPMAANVTTTAYMPKPDFTMAQDLYNEIDKLETRISMITEAIKVVGVYDKSAKDVERVFKEGIENDLIPVDNWAMWAEKGGMQGVIEWLPIEQIASVLEKLTARRNDAKAQLFEITGLSDIMRGTTPTGGAVSATERALESRFASVRVQALQDEFADYATDLIRLRAEVVQRFFEPQIIMKQSNIMNTVDGKTNPQAVMQAIQLIKDDQSLIWRVSVKPESVSMVDYAKLQNERTNYITALATYMQSAVPLIEAEPSSKPLVLEMLKWGLAGFKGSQDVEGLLDLAIEAAMQQDQQGEKPSPEEIKAMSEREQRQHEERMEVLRFNHENRTAQVKAMLDQGEVTHETNERIRELMFETAKDIEKEIVQRDANMEEESHETDEYRERKNIDVQTARRMPTGRTANA